MRSILHRAFTGERSGWTAPLAIWVASRVFSTALLVVMYCTATATGWTFASHRTDPSFFTFSGSWDASFYRIIASNGYPASLPTDAAGHVEPNAWAFLPVFPFLVRCLMAATGASFWVAGVAIAGACGAGTVIVLYRLVRHIGGSTRARRATALFAFGPMGFLLQVSYAESTFLLLTFGALLALIARQYWLVAVLGVVAAFTRPGILALAVAIAVHLVARYVSRRRDPFPWRSRVAVVLCGLIVAGAGLAWPLIATAVTGVHDAYTATELAWWTGFVGRVHFVPVTPWFLMAGTWLGPAGIALVAIAMIAAGLLLSRRPVRALGPETFGFVASYAAYLFAVFLPQQSVLRLLMPAAPLLGIDPVVRTRKRTVTLLVAGMCLQAAAIVVLWFLSFP